MHVAARRGLRSVGITVRIHPEEAIAPRFPSVTPSEAGDAAEGAHRDGVVAPQNQRGHPLSQCALDARCQRFASDLDGLGILDLAFPLSGDDGMRNR